MNDVYEHDREVEVLERALAGAGYQLDFPQVSRLRRARDLLDRQGLRPQHVFRLVELAKAEAEGVLAQRRLVARWVDTAEWRKRLGV